MSTMMIILFIITVVGSQEIPTPATLLGPNYFNYHPYEIQFLKENVQPTKQGPVLFPNDGPPPPKRPLVVTSRPLLESIANSDLNNTSVTTERPSEAQNTRNFDIFDQNLIQNIPEAYNNIEYQASSYRNVPYRARLGFVRDNGYDYEEAAALPPIYRGLEDRNQNLLDIQRNKMNYNYQPNTLYYTNQYENEPDENRNTHDHDQYKNYAFSYTVRDQKTGDDFSHSQHSSGAATSGEYRVRLPDGRTQIVSYTADENGYKADVRYDGENEKAESTNYYNANNNNPTKSYNNIRNNYENVNQNLYQDIPTDNYNKLNTNINYNKNAKETIPIKEPDYSKEYYDYSAEYDNNYQPYITKFNFIPVSSTVVPTVKANHINDLLNQRITSTPAYADLVAGSNNQVKYDSTTEKVNLIGNNVKNKGYTLVTTPKTFVPSTPASYLASTIASLREKLAAKSTVSSNLISRINKYLSFKK